MILHRSIFIGVVSLCFIGFPDVSQPCKELMALVAQQIQLAAAEGQNQLDYTKNYHDELSSVGMDLWNLIPTITGLDSETQGLLYQYANLIYSYNMELDYTLPEIQDALDEIEVQRQLLADADCDCGGGGVDPGGGTGSGGGTNSNCGCCCADELHEIRDKVIELDNACDAFFARARLYFDRAEFYHGVVTDFCNKVEHRLWIPDDGLYQDLKNLSDTFKANYQNLLSSSNLPSLFTHTLFTDVGYPFTNEGIVGLFGLATQMNDTLLQIDQANTLHYIASNMNYRTYGELAFISNYLDKVQRSYFEQYKSIDSWRTAATLNKNNPFHSSNYSNVTNFWQTPNMSSYRQYVFDTSNTNWFQRIEWALYGIAGFFDAPRQQLEQDTDLSSKTSVDNYFDSITNSFSFAEVGAYTNTVKGFVSRFGESVSKFALPDSSSSDTGITVIPSFSLGGIGFESVILTFESLKGVTDFIRSLFKVIWYAIFAVVAFRVIVKMIGMLLVTIAHIIVVVKSLL